MDSFYHPFESCLRTCLGANTQSTTVRRRTYIPRYFTWIDLCLKSRILSTSLHLTLIDLCHHLFISCLQTCSCERPINSIPNLNRSMYTSFLHLTDEPVCAHTRAWRDKQFAETFHAYLASIDSPPPLSNLTLPWHIFKRALWRT